MIRSKINSELRAFAKTLSPTQHEQQDIGLIYKSICDLLGTVNCIQIGSYPRFTAITPLHDLDILYCIGQWSQAQHNPQQALNDLLEKLKNEYENPTKYSLSLELQNHSVVLLFKESGEEKFSVDLVPCYSFSVNEYGDPMYMVSEIIKEKKHLERRKKSWNPNDSHQWIKSDPRGYISQATEVGKNTDFRKAVKIIKFWKSSIRENIDDNLKLKSFHLEQVITNYFKENSELDLIGSIFKFFFDLPEIIENPNDIEDRAQEGKYIDDYLADFTEEQKKKIKQARDSVLVKLEEIQDETSPEEIFTSEPYDRNPDERFMFDEGIIICHDPENHLASIRCDDHANRQLARGSQHTTNDEKLYFKLKHGIRSGYRYYWKVKNSDKLHKSKRRGDITLGRTKNYPETTKYEGLHYVECFAVNTLEECISRQRHEVPIAVGGN